jgi:SAM-dependent methyltransferase
MGEIIPRPVPPTPLRFTGERLTSLYGIQTEIEHLHRYLLAREWCRGKDVLDVASGEGYGTAMLAQVARSATGIEISTEAASHAAEAYGRDGLQYVQGDARSIPLPDASFDVVVSFETIEHFAEQEQFLDEIRRVLRPGGLLIVSTPDRDNYSPADMPANPYHVLEMTGEEFETLLRSRFSNISVIAQRPIFGSVLFPAGASTAPPICFERRGDAHFEASIGLARPQYIVAFASDEPIPALPASVYVETGRLGMLSPMQAEAEINSLKNALAGQFSDDGPHLAELRDELAVAQGEIRAQKAANDMTERVFVALREDSLALHRVVADKERALAVAQHQASENGRQVQALYASTSWRITAPLRRLISLVRR